METTMLRLMSSVKRTPSLHYKVHTYVRMYVHTLPKLHAPFLVCSTISVIIESDTARDASPDFEGIVLMLLIYEGFYHILHTSQN